MATHEQMQALGARCDVCPLRHEGSGPCSSEILPGTDRIAISQEPGNAEILADRPFAGRSGGYLDETLQAIGAHRRQLSTTHLVACMPPGGDINAYESTIRRRNRHRIAEGRTPLPSPVACCAPRMHREVAPFNRVIPLGSIAAQHIVPNMRGGILKTRGRLVEVPTHLTLPDGSQRAMPDPRPCLAQWNALIAEGINPAMVPGRKIMPMLNPAFVQRSPEYGDAFLADLHRAWRWWAFPEGSEEAKAYPDGLLRPVRPARLYRPDIASMERILLHHDLPGWAPLQWRGRRVHVHDWETTSIHPWNARPRCLGVGTFEWAMIIPYEPVQWAREEHARRKEAVAIRKRLVSEGWDLAPAIAESIRRAWQEASGVRDFEQFYRLNDGSTLPLYDAHEQRERDRIVKAWTRDPRILKFGWNSVGYDDIVTTAAYGNGCEPHLDGMFVHCSVQPDLPHNLGDTGSIWTDVHDWKGDMSHSDTKNDGILWDYACPDNAVPADMIPRMWEVAEQRGQVPVILMDHALQRIGTGMHYVGMGVDQEERDRLATVLASPGPAKVRDKKGVERDIPMGVIHRWVLRVRQILDKSGVDVSDIVNRTKKLDRANQEWLESLELEDREQEDVDAEDAFAAPGALPPASELGLDILAFNPGSHPQLRAVLFDEWELPTPSDLKEKELYTSSGEISTGDAVLRRLLADQRLTPDQRAFIHSVRMFRRHAKVFGTYVRPMRLPTGDLELDRGCRVWSDGRLHASWRARGAVTGRYACVTGDTVLETSRGIFTFAEYTPVSGDMVWTHRHRWRPILRKIYKGAAPMYRVSFDDSRASIKCSGEHRLLTPQGWMRLSDLHVGDSVVIDVRLPVLHERPEKRGAGAHGVPQCSEADYGRCGQRTEYDLAQRVLHPSHTSLARETQGRTGASVLQGKCATRTSADGPGSACVEGWYDTVQGRVRYDPHEWHVCPGTSARHGAGSRNGDPSRRLPCASHRRGQDEQRPGQSRVGDSSGTRQATCPTTRIRSITPLGTMDVWDIEVAEDSSYYTQGLCHHNSNGPNMQNLPSIAKAMIVAGPGNVLVSRDMDQIELRVAASRWQITRLLEAFDQGLDPYQMSMESVYGMSAMMNFQGAPSSFGKKDFAKGSQFEKMRKLAKAIALASQYAAGCAFRGGQVEVIDILTIFRLITSAEDKATGELMYPDLTDTEVAAMHDRWLKGFPEYPMGWRADALTVRRQGYLQEPVGGRRRDFPGSKQRKLPEISNFGAQGGASALMNLIIVELSKVIQPNQWGPGTGINNQCHDAITVECPLELAQQVDDIMGEIMNLEHPALPGVRFTSEGGIAWPDKDPMGRGMSRYSEA